MGGRKPDTSDREILSIFFDADDQFLSTAEVSEELSYSSTGTFKRLQLLEEEGLLDSKKIGQSMAWWLTDDGRNWISSSTDEFATDIGDS